MIILSAWLFSYYFVSVAQIPSAIKRGFKMHPGRRLKPFDCVTCLSVWVAVALYFAPAEWVRFIAIVFAAGNIGNVDWITWLRDMMYKLSRR